MDSFLPQEEFLEAFRRLPQKVLWKYEGLDLDLPPNVMTRAWLPQQDILGENLNSSNCTMKYNPLHST